MNSLSKKTNDSILNTYIGLPKEIYILFLGKMINCIGAFVHPLLALILTQKIGLSPSEAGIFITFAAAFQAPCIILGGKLSDTYGRKKTLVLFQSIAAILFIICGFIKPSHFLTFLIIAAGCFSSIAQPSYDSMVGDITNKDNRQASFSLIYMGLNLGFAIGPLVGGLLYKNFLPLVFIGDGITTIISVILIFVFIKETYKNPKIETDQNVLKDTTLLEDNETGSVFKVFLRRPILIYYSLILLTFQFAYSQWGFAVPLQLSSLFGDGLGAKYFGILASCNAIIVVLFTPIATKITRKMKIISAIAIGGLFYALAFGSCGFITSSLWPFFFIIFIITIGEIVISINSSTFITNMTPASHRGRVNSILPLIYGTGGAIGPTIMGVMIDNLGLKIAWLFVGIVVLIGSIFMYMLNYLNFKKR